MRLRFLASVVSILMQPAITFAAAPIELEVATERGVQITAPQEWLQLLTSIGIDNVRIRGAQPGDEPRVENLGTDDTPRYLVAGILTSQNQLELPGGTFSRRDSGRLKTYFERLAAEGGDTFTVPRGIFGLTEKEIEVVFADLTQPIDFETSGQAPRTALDRLQSKFQSKCLFTQEAAQVFREAVPLADELRGVSAGTGLAIMLRREGLVLTPEKPRGQPLVFRIASADRASIDASTLGKSADLQMSHWPIGWALQTTPGETAPSLFEYLNAEIDGYTLEESLAAIAPRIKIPLFVDHAVLAAHRIEPSKVQVRLERTRTFYKRVIDRALAQGRLGSQIRIDEAGTPFLWISR